MGLNQLLGQEQIAIMRRDAAIDPRLAERYEREIDRLGKLLRSHPYPHRYFPYCKDRRRSQET